MRQPKRKTRAEKIEDGQPKQLSSYERKQRELRKKEAAEKLKRQGRR